MQFDVYEFIDDTTTLINYNILDAREVIRLCEVLQMCSRIITEETE